MTQDELFYAMYNRTNDGPLYYIKVGNSKVDIACMYDLLTRMYAYGITVQNSSFEVYVNKIIHTVCDKGIDLFITVYLPAYGTPSIATYNEEAVHSQIDLHRKCIGIDGSSINNTAVAGPVIIYNVSDLVRSWYDGKVKSGDTITVRDDLAALIDDRYDVATNNQIWYVDQDISSNYSGKEATICYVNEHEGDAETTYILMFDMGGDSRSEITIPNIVWTNRMFEQEDNFDMSESCITNLYSA